MAGSLLEQESRADIHRILQDMADGVMVLNRNGAISYLNHRAMTILGVDESALNQTILMLFIEDKENESFVQNILDAVYAKGLRQRQMLPFHHNGRRRILEMSSTYLSDQGSLILVFTDVTEREALIKRHHDSAVFVSALFTLVCLSVLLHELLDMVIPGVIPPNVFTIIVEILAAILVLIVYRFNGYTIRDLNLGLKGFKSTCRWCSAPRPHFWPPCAPSRRTCWPSGSISSAKAARSSVSTAGT